MQEQMGLLPEILLLWNENNPFMEEMEAT